MGLQRFGHDWGTNIQTVTTVLNFFQILFIRVWRGEGEKGNPKWLTWGLPVGWDISRAVSFGPHSTVASASVRWVLRACGASTPEPGRWESTVNRTHIQPSRVHIQQCQRASQGLTANSCRDTVPSACKSPLGPQEGTIVGLSSDVAGLGGWRQMARRGAGWGPRIWAGWEGGCHRSLTVGQATSW